MNIMFRLAMLAGLMSWVGCASIINQGKKDIKVSSNPADAKVTVYDGAGNVVRTTQTPAMLKLDRGAGYFKGANYRLVVEKAGYKSAEVPLTSGIEGWYWGNLGFGGIIGFLAVDPATGAMWTLHPDDVSVQLMGGQASWSDKGGLSIVLKEQLSPEQQQRLIPLPAPRS